MNQRRRIWLVTSTFLQTLLVLAAMLLRVLSRHPEARFIAMATVALLSFSCGGQIGLAVCVKLQEINTTMITGALVQLATDRKLFNLKNAARDRKVLFFAALLAGAFAGAALNGRWSGAGTIGVAAAIKGLVCVSFLFNHGMVNKGKRGEERQRLERERG